MAGVSPPLRVTADPAWGWCAGLRHPPAAEYPAGFFTAAQLAEMEADAALRVERVPSEAELAAAKAQAQAREAAEAAERAEAQAQAEADAARALAEAEAAAAEAQAKAAADAAAPRPARATTRRGA